MPQHTWVFDAPTGVYKNHEMSMDLRMASVEDSVFMDHTRPESDYGKGKGESITITRVSNVGEPTDSTLDENVRIPEDDFTLSTRQVTVSEIGRSIPYSSLSRDLSEFDIENPIQKKLMQQMRLTIDTKASVAFKDTQIKAHTTSGTAMTFSTGGVFGGTSNTNLTIAHLELIRDYMYDDLNADPAEGNDYVGIFRTKGIRGIKSDADYEEWQKYTDPTNKFNSEQGRWESIRLIETNHANALANVGTASVLGEGVVFGSDAVVMAEAMMPELRAATPTDFGRSKAVAWYGILEFGSVWGDSANKGEANVVHVGSL